MSEAKPYSISKELVVRAWELVKANRGAAGVDKVSVRAFEKDLGNQLHKIWNRMSSGSYFPPPVRLVEIPKGDGVSTRPLGIPTVADRVAQAVVKLVLEPRVEPVFHPDSYGYRPGRSAHDAVRMARQRCWEFDWVVEVDIKGFFDNIPHDLIERALARHTDVPWVRLYVGRWLRAPLQHPDGAVVPRTKGTPQGGVISPLLANLFLHYAFDAWMQRSHAQVPFERYADDILVHCRTRSEAESVLLALRTRFAACGLELHPVKTRIVYCKDSRRRETAEPVRFDFLGFTFCARPAPSRRGGVFFGFMPALSASAVMRLRRRLAQWNLGSRTQEELRVLLPEINRSLRGWYAYYSAFYPSLCRAALRLVNQALVRWAVRKYKRFRRSLRAATQWLQRVARAAPQTCFAWSVGVWAVAGK